VADRKFDGKTAFITGAGSGIGREACLAFVAEGASVVGVDLSYEGLQGTRSLVAERGGRMQALAFDVSDEQAVAQGFAEAVSLFGSVDMAFNNAGISHRQAPTADLRLGDFERILKVNVIGVWLCMREELRLMERQGGGVIVNTASLCSSHIIANLTAYTASKHALLGLTKSAAVEYGPKNIRVNCIAPGSIPTGMMDQALHHLSEEEQRRAIAATAELHPLKRLGSTTEVADAVVFLCSKQASFITGACLPVDGGWGAI
jgi:A-factor type gamma-butyrolactone 1'-reductase (1S-forming)